MESCPEESRISDDDTESALKVNNYWIFCKRGYAKQDDLLSCTNYIQWATQLKNKRRKCAPKDGKLNYSTFSESMDLIIYIWLCGDKKTKKKSISSVVLVTLRNPSSN